MDLNRVMIIGRLTRDPENRSTPTGVSVTTMGIATNYSWTDTAGTRQDKVEYHNIVLWRKIAEVAAQYLRKGSRVYIEGRLQTRDWEGQDGVKRSRTEIIADNMIMLDGKGDFRGPVDSGNASSVGTELPSMNSESEEEIKVENIPF